MASAPAPRRGWAETLRVVVPALLSLLVAILRGEVARRVRANLTVSRHPKEGGGGGEDEAYPGGGGAAKKAGGAKAKKAAKRAAAAEKSANKAPAASLEDEVDADFFG